ncbi:MAG: VWA domain-containing protein [Acidobacteriota bacterium]
MVVSAEYARKGKYRRKALVVVSDGDDRDSSFTIEQTIDKLSEFDVQLYFIGFPDDLSEDSGIFKHSPRKKAIELINKLTSESGGQAYYPKELTDLESIAQKIGTDLRSQYTIGYYPSNQKQDSSFRRLQVRLTDNRDQYAIRTRSGYYAAKEGGGGRIDKLNRSEHNK